jgi:hypothetical protein
LLAARAPSPRPPLALLPASPRPRPGEALALIGWFGSHLPRVTRAWGPICCWLVDLVRDPHKRSVCGRALSRALPRSPALAGPDGPALASVRACRQGPAPALAYRYMRMCSHT